MREEIAWKEINLLVLDVDGILTDGKIILSSDGSEIKCFSALDGIGLHAIMRIGIDVAVISARLSRVTELRMNELGIERVYQGSKNKLAVYRELCNELNIDSTSICFMGDDDIDISVMTECGIGVSVPNGSDNARAAADYLTSRAGGCGAVREVCDLLLQANNTSIADLFS